MGGYSRMSTPKPIIGVTPGKPYIMVQETSLLIMKPTETSVLIIPGSCITFTEHTEDRGDITHTGIITSIDLSIDISTRGNGLIICNVNGVLKEIGITTNTYKKNGNDWSTIKMCPYKSTSNYKSNTGLDPLGGVPFTNAGGKRRRRTRQARRRKNRRTRSRK